MSTEVETSPRRHRRRDFLTLGAAAAAVVAGTGKAQSAPTDTAVDAPVLDLIRREDEIRTAGVILQDEALVLERDATAEQLADPVFRFEIAEAPSSCAAEVEATRVAWAECIDGYAKAATPVTSAQVWKAWVRAARY